MSEHNISSEHPENTDFESIKILAVDTSAKTAAAAICRGNTTLAGFARQSGLSHSELMLPEIDLLFKKTALSPRDIELFAVSSGPGSFTGVRIGVSLIKGLAFGTGKPCVGVSTLASLAANGKSLSSSENFLACCVMDARRNQLYNAMFSYVGGKAVRLCPDRLISADELKIELEGSNLPVYFFGDGYEIARAAFPCARSTPEELIFQSASSVAHVALEKYIIAKDKSHFTSLALAPSYLRSSQAEREYGKDKTK